ncbi:hypothetical protein MCCPILRI181_00086 [Mycoplasma capricolum subsp. capripneumoniae]|nr:hypothetical protein Mccp14020TZ_00880 [Mycoplasma capricolum subsp. capripneumoniae]CEA10454.1 hypothetical protein MCCPILRI181_00086 [Mycoplasma capricolum subsp. capripneumoniae]CEA11458.1 hypothetical protein MCCPF38_00092 [Mycoplasma capricolum subsp. capripneumoniae]
MSLEFSTFSGILWFGISGLISGFLLEFGIVGILLVLK